MYTTNFLEFNKY